MSARRSAGGEAKSGGRAERILFLLDARNFDRIRSGHKPEIPYSHDRNLFQFAHEALKAGMSVSFARDFDSARNGDVLEVRQVYPSLSIQRDRLDRQGVAFVVSAGLEHLAIRGQFGDARVIGVVPALHMTESPLGAPAQPVSWIEALRGHVDAIVVQNDRMKDIVAVLCHWLARWEADDRILVAPLGFVEGVSGGASLSRGAARAQLGYKSTDVILANAGGAWGWTDCDVFIEALVAHVEARRSRLKAFFPGLRQRDNPEVNRVAERIEALAAAKPQFFAEHPGEDKPICLGGDWELGGRMLPQVLAAADIGISVSKGGFEAWQSHRVRFVEYVEAGLPIFCTSESLLAARARPATVQVEAGSHESYLAAFSALDDDRALLASLRKGVKDFRPSLASGATYGEMIKRLKLLPRRDFSRSLDRSFLDILRERIRGEELQVNTDLILRNSGMFDA